MERGQTLLLKLRLNAGNRYNDALSSRINICHILHIHYNALHYVYVIYIYIYKCGRRLKLSTDLRDMSGVAKAQNSINDLANSLELVHRSLFIGVLTMRSCFKLLIVYLYMFAGTSSFSPITYKPLVDHYEEKGIELYIFKDSFPYYGANFTMKEGLWEGTRRYIGSALVLSYINPSIPDLSKEMNWRFIMGNVHTLIREFEKNLDLELQLVEESASLLDLINFISSVLLLVALVFIVFVVMRPAFNTLYYERLTMFCLFNSLPKSTVHEMTKMTFTIADGEGGDMGKEGSIADSKDDPSAMDDDVSDGGDRVESELNSRMAELEDDHSAEHANNNMSVDQSVATLEKSSKKLSKAEKARRINRKMEMILGAKRAVSMLNSAKSGQEESHDHFDIVQPVTALRKDGSMPFVFIVIMVFIILIGVISSIIVHVVTLSNLRQAKDACFASRRRHTSALAFFTAQVR